MRGNVILAVCILIATGFIYLPLASSGSDTTGVYAGSNPYGIGPLQDIVTAMEDEVYSSRYFAVMGDMRLNSFTTDADWLTTSDTAPLVLDTTYLEAQWSFDQRDARDDSGNGHDGTLNGATPGSGAFGIGSAMTFDGTSHITVPHSASLNITSEITVEAFIYPTFTDSGEHMIISKGGYWGDDDPQDYEITMDDDRPLFQIKIPFSDDWYGAAPMDPIVKNMWHHVAGVYDGTRFYIYIDGINQTTLYNGWGASYKGSVYSGGLPTSTDDISIGRRAPAPWGSLFFKGTIDEVRIFDKALSADEILEHATRPTTKTITISGTPDNKDVGNFNVNLNITDGQGNFAERKFILTVENDPPEILTENVLTIYQDEEYSVDYSADDEGLGITYWQMDTGPSWLKMEQASGLLHGIPTNADVGTHHVKITFYDGKGGQISSEFDLEVLDINDPPSITTTSLPDASEDEFYSVQLQGEDIDGEEIEWSWQTNATWLGGETGSYLNGTPTNDDVGTYNITVKAQDPRGLFVTSMFEFSVINVNDIPEWVDVPGNTTIKEGELFVFDVNATDVDVGDELVYTVDSYPAANISINYTTGQMEWLASRDPFSEIAEIDAEGPFILDVVIGVTDGEELIDHRFEINMTPVIPPTTTLVGPIDEMVIAGNTTQLTWETENPEMMELIYRVYFSDVKSQVDYLDDDVMTEVNGTTLEVGDLDPGTTYYWTVIPVGGQWTGLCLNDTFSFFVDTPPTSQLASPANGERISAFEPLVTWTGNDADGDPLLFDIYLGTTLEDVSSMSVGLMIAQGWANTSILLYGLMPGTTYYWTVEPSDGYTNGLCTSGVFSFVTNTPPQLMPLNDLQVEVGKELWVDIEGVDADDGDLGNFTFSFETSLEGMSIDASTGVLTWTPYESQIGDVSIIVRLSDGIDQTNMTINIQVLKVQEDEEEDEGGVFSPMVIIIIAVVAAVILAVIVIVFLLMRKKKPEEPEAPGPSEETPEEPAGEMPGPETEPIPLIEGPVQVDVPPPEPEPAPIEPEAAPPEPIASEEEVVPPEPPVPTPEGPVPNEQMPNVAEEGSPVPEETGI